MKYTEEDYNFINNWLNKCVKIESDENICHITSDNIVRQLKYNQLFKNNKEITFDLTKMTFNDNVILDQRLKTKFFNINYYKIWLFFESKYNYKYQEIKDLINNILYDIFKLKEYTSGPIGKYNREKLSEILNLKNIKQIIY